SESSDGLVYCGPVPFPSACSHWEQQGHHYFRYDDGTDITSKNYSYRDCLIDIPSTFHHVQYDLASRRVLNVGPQVEIWGEKIPFLINIRECSGSLLIKNSLVDQQENILSTDGIQGLLDQGYMDYDYKQFSRDSQGQVTLKDCSSDCRDTVVYGNNQLKIFANWEEWRPDKPDWLFYIPAAGKTAADNDVVYYATPKEYMWPWLKRGHGAPCRLVGIGVHNTTPQPKTVGGVEIKVYYDPRHIEPDPDCPALVQ
ncbi:MAG: hypothetical protein AAFV25_21415, partial [Bacteroidota bacterium]